LVGTPAGTQDSGSPGGTSSTGTTFSDGLGEGEATTGAEELDVS